MLKLKKETVFSPSGIFIIYVIASYLAIMVFRFIFPGEKAPLAHFFVSWRFIRGCLDFLSLYPALALSSLVIPFGLKARPPEQFNPFSSRFLNSLKPSIFTAIAASVLYAALLFLALPAAKDYDADLRYQAKLYHLALKKAREFSGRDEWPETARMVAICDRIWPEGTEIEKLRIESNIRAEHALLARIQSPRTAEDESAAAQPGLPGSNPLEAVGALVMAETALTEERWYDAHWLATLAERLSEKGSVETAEARRLASLAWNGVSSLEPNARETRAHSTYLLKRDGYNALLADDWIRAYYIFRELSSLSPEDPDVEKYLGMSEKGTLNVAFFADEKELALGDIMTGAMFSLPMGSVPAGAAPGSEIIPGGRIVMRVSSLSIFPDYAYGIDNEIMAFDREGRPAWRMEARYAKLLPLFLSSGSRVTVMMRALDREDKNKRWEPAAEGMGKEAPAGAQITLGLNWEDFLLLSEIRRGPDFLSPGELRAASTTLGSRGYLPQVFEAELIQRFAEPIFLLPIAVFIIVIGWRFRSHKRPRYLRIPMLGVLPAVFSCFVHFYRGCLNNMGIWAVVTLGFSSSILVFAAAALVLLILSLIILAAQHG
jgi:hypothetical protein